MLVLPALEHSMRRVFACVNGCPERAVTAEVSQRGAHTLGEKTDSLVVTATFLLSNAVNNALHHI